MGVIASIVASFPMSPFTHSLLSSPPSPLRLPFHPFTMTSLSLPISTTINIHPFRISRIEKLLSRLSQIPFFFSTIMIITIKCGFPWEREGIASMWQPVFPLVTVVDRDELDLIMETWKESRRDEREEERKEEINRARLGVFNPFSKGLERRRSEEVFHGLRRTEKGITQSFPNFTLSSLLGSIYSDKDSAKTYHGWYSIPSPSTFSPYVSHLLGCGSFV